MPLASPDLPAAIRIDGAVRIGAASTIIGDGAALDRARAVFAEHHAVALADALDPALLATLTTLVRANPFEVDEEYRRIGLRATEVGDRVGSALRLMLDRPAFRDWAAAMAGSEPLTHVTGLITQMRPGADDVIHWHDDCNIVTRRIAVIVHLGDGPFTGGVFEMGAKADGEVRLRVGHVPAGTILLFRVSPALRHRVTAVEGGALRRVFAGWLNTAAG